jgi:hypothetical protein
MPAWALRAHYGNFYSTRYYALRKIYVAAQIQILRAQMRRAAARLIQGLRSRPAARFDVMAERLWRVGLISREQVNRAQMRNVECYNLVTRIVYTFNKYNSGEALFLPFFPKSASIRAIFGERDSRAPTRAMHQLIDTTNTPLVSALTSSRY